MLDQTQLIIQWEKFTSHFHDKDIQENIRTIKEEQYQEGFCRDLFVNILGYTLNPNLNYNLTTELKNIRGSKKADAGIIIDEKVTAVIELKGMNTTDLNKIEAQVFGYKVNHKGCHYVITSNFEKLRFYIDDSVEYLEFNLFKLTQEEFNVFYLCLSYDNIKKNLPKKIKEESLSKEEAITKQLYQDYSQFKKLLFQNLIQLNPQYEQLQLFQKSQKLLDRFLFIFFAEDRGLLPPNSVRLILQQWEKLNELDEYVPLYDRFKKYFGYMNTGFKGKIHDVFAYNGGLFKPDDILDNIKIDDNILYQNTKKIAEYDFNSEIDVNILGHIFENSLNEIDEIKAYLAGKKVDKKQTKRKKDGVFYTPKYITQYIVKNTLGQVCQTQKNSLNINDAEYTSDKNRQTRTKQKLLNNLNLYREWLLELTILDPTCGSGAFLNQALDFLIQEHNYIDELESKIMGSSLILSNIENSILEKNLYGVDINDESIEIAKLSLWLRTAKPQRKLNNLSYNLKCGNSLIDDPTITANKYFNWQEEFPQVFSNGGFDIIIGNPPYGDFFSNIEKEYILKNYAETFSGTYDIYISFFEKSINILKKSGYLGFITPDTYLNYSQFIGLRTFLRKNNIQQIIKLNGVFEDAIVDTSIIILNKEEKQDKEFKAQVNKKPIKQIIIDQIQSLDSENLSNDSFILSNSGDFNVFDFLKGFDFTLKDYIKITQGITTGGNEAFINTKEYFLNNHIDKNIVNKVIKGKNINKYCILHDGDYILYSTKSLNEENQNMIANLLMPYYSKLSSKRETKKGTLPWYCLHWSRDEKDFNEPKILIRQTANYIIAALDQDNLYPIDTLHTLNVKPNINVDKIQFLKNVLCILNSQLFKFLYQWRLNEEGIIYPQIKKVNIEWLPFPSQEDILRSDLSPLTDKIDLLLFDLENYSKKFHKMLKRKFNIKEISKKLLGWHELTFDEFITELKKQKVELSLSQEYEWEDFFSQEKKKLNILKQEIQDTELLINKKVYKLYNLTDYEIEIIENNE